jgi:hypothetical protein
MKIIAKHAFVFVLDEIVTETSKVSGQPEAVQKIIATCKVKPSVFPQDCPDWVKDTDLFKLAVEDRNAKVVA